MIRKSRNFKVKKMLKTIKKRRFKKKMRIR